jgi:hypothetical protein
MDQERKGGTSPPEAHNTTKRPIKAMFRRLYRAVRRIDLKTVAAIVGAGASVWRAWRGGS